MYYILILGYQRFHRFGFVEDKHPFDKLIKHTTPTIFASVQKYRIYLQCFSFRTHKFDPTIILE